MSEQKETKSQVILFLDSLVRVGGGYLSLDEFLDIYTPMELERVERNDPIKKFSEKVAVQKTLQYHSPIRSPRNNTGSIDSGIEKTKKIQLSSPTSANSKAIVLDGEKNGTPQSANRSEKRAC